MERSVVFVGGGHAHLTALRELQDLRKSNAQVTLINPSAYHYYSGMGPGMLSGYYRPQEIRFHVRKMVEDRGALFIEDAVTQVNPEKRTLLISKEELRGLAMEWSLTHGSFSGRTARQFIDSLEGRVKKKPTK